MKHRLYFKLLLSLVIVMQMTSFSLAQTFSYNENTGENGFTLKSSSKSALVLQHTIDKFNLSDVDIQGETMKTINYGISVIPMAVGAPNIPSIGRYLLIPKDAQVQVNIINQQIETYQNIKVAPAAAIPFDTEEEKPAVKGKFYQENAFFPAEIYHSNITEVRGMTMALINISPFQYNPITEELIVYKNIELEIKIIGGKGAYIDNRFRNHYWDQILEDLVYNTQDIPEIDYSKRFANTKDDNGCDYLIIIPNKPDFVSWADSIKVFRTEQGINTKVVTTEDFGGNTLSNIKDYMNTVYETWDPVPAGVLLMADYGNDDNTITSKSYPHPYSGNYISDNYYADYTGNHLPDFVFARMTAQDATDLEIMVNKFISYERNPPVDIDFYNNPITALGWQTERWFQLCSESVGGYMTNVLGKEPVRINAVYDGNPNSDPWSTATNTNLIVDYFGPSGQGYIPATPAELGGWNGGSASDVVNAINAGAFILQHRDHGSTTGWGEPGFHSNHISQLNNVDKLSHIFSINCLTGQFNLAGECFAEKFHRYNNGGALSLTAASQISYSFVNDAFVWGMYDNMWPNYMPDYGGNQIEQRDFLPAFGSASGKYFLDYTNWASDPDMEIITFRLFHHHGDAFNTVYTEVPQEMNINYAEVVISGNDVVEVEAEEGAMIALSVEGELIGVAQGAAGSTSVNFNTQVPGTEIKIVITKQNYFRHIGYIMVIAPEGPYIVKSNFSINDSQGNNNGLVDFDEDISLDFSVKNLGTEDALNIVVSITSSDEYITINDGDEDFGTLNPDEEKTINDAFSFKVTNNIPDQHYIEFDFSATDGTDVWESSFSIKANAPKVEILDMVITEIDGNGNGSIDPGEDATIAIQFTNNGHAVSAEGLSSIISASDFLTINSSEFSFESLDIDAIMTAEFSVSVSEDTSTGSSIIFTNTVDAGSYSAIKEFGFKVGLIIEDWETGDFNKYSWLNSGNSDWMITDVDPYEGTYCAKSGTIGHNQQSTLSITYYVSFDDKINFFAKVSSENSYDFLKFYIDGSEKGSWSGDMDWSEMSYDVTEGEHTFKWEYKKDGSATGGNDCAWVDYITLPTMLFPKADAGEDGEICQGGSTDYQLDAVASDYESLNWTTSGDGTFSQDDIVDPVYSMGTNDEANGFVELALTAAGANGDVTNTMLLTIVEMPLQADMPQGETNICHAAQEQLFTIVDGTDHYNWTISPAEAAEITTHENIAYVSFNESFMGEASLSATAFNVCGEADASEAIVLYIAEQATAAFMGDTQSCIGSEAILSIELTGVAPWNVELTDENGAEIYFEATETPHELTVNTEETMTYTLVTVKDANNCDGLVNSSALVTVNDLPTALLNADDTEVCAGEIIEVELTLTGLAPWIVSLGNGSDISQEFEVTEASEIVEFIAPYTSFDLQVNTINDANECLGTSEGIAAIDVKASPMVDLGGDTAICIGNVYLLDAQNVGDTYAWSTGETTQTIEVDESMADSNNDLIVTVDVNNATGCMSTDEVIVHFKDCTGINELLADDVQLMPNPNTGRFILNIPSHKDITNISIHNNLGELITQIQKSEIQTQMNIDVSHLSNGVYFVIIRSSENQISKRFIIRK